MIAADAKVADAGASCLDAPRSAPLIDVVALSVGRPDGIYYAGKKFTPWMSYTDEQRLNDLCARVRLPGDPLRPGEEAERLALLRRRQNESVVVRWSIDGGYPSVATLLTAGAARLQQQTRDEKNDSFRWGAPHSYRYASWLAFFLLHEAFDATKGGFRAPGQARSGNDYPRFQAEFIESLGEDWVLAQADVVRHIYLEDIAWCRAQLNRLKAEAIEMGINVEAEMAA